MAESLDAKIEGLRLDLYPSELVQLYFRMPYGSVLKPFSFERRDYLKAIYDTSAKRVLLMFGRQCEKSTSLGNMLLAYCMGARFFKALYVSPAHLQTSQFSNDRLRQPISYSETLQQFLGLPDRIMHKSFITGSEIRLRNAFLNADRIRGLMTDLLCYGKDTEVLTKSGWKSVADISEHDLLADVNDMGVVEWSSPTRLIRKNHSGEMVTFSHRGFSLRVTDDHNMWVNHRVRYGDRYKRKDRWEFAKAIDLAGGQKEGFKMTCKAEWVQDHGDEIKSFPEWEVEQKVSSRKGWTGRTRVRAFPGLDVPYGPFAKLVGWYISEGHIQWLRPKTGRPSPRPVITQNPGKNLDDILCLLDECGLSYSVYETKGRKALRVLLNSSILGRYFAELGKSYDKYIPREFFDRPTLLAGVLEGIYRGDGMHHPGQSWDQSVLRTRSKRLAEDVQEAWLRLGRPAPIHTKMVKPSKDQASDIEPLPMYEIPAHSRDYMVFWRKEFEAKNRISVEPVENEEVYCFTIKNHRPIVKGSFGSKPVISGNCIDEIQSILTDLLPVIEETLFSSEYKMMRYSGTPLSVDNTLSRYYYLYSTQNEWVIPCWRHTPQYWNVVGEENIPENADLGLVCAKCKKPIDPMGEGAQWASMNPKPSVPLPFEGYRLPQLVTPRADWYEILDKRTRYSRQRFFNEVLALPYDSGLRPITREDLQKNCDPSSSIYDLPQFERNKLWAKKRAMHGTYMGIDWGTGEKSYTFVTIGSYCGGDTLRVIYAHRFTGAETEPIRQLEMIRELVAEYQVKLIAADYGGGFDRNDQLIRWFGPQRVFKYQYAGGSHKLRWDGKLGRYLCRRSELMTDLFTTIKRGGIITFPNWEEMESVLAPDLLSVYSEYNEARHMTVYDHPPDQPDDGTHSLLYMLLASIIHHPRPDIIFPTKENP